MPGSAPCAPIRRSAASPPVSGVRSRRRRRPWARSSGRGRPLPPRRTSLGAESRAARHGLRSASAHGARAREGRARAGLPLPAVVARACGDRAPRDLRARRGLCRRCPAGAGDPRRHVRSAGRPAADAERARRACAASRAPRAPSRDGDAAGERGSADDRRATTHRASRAHARAAARGSLDRGSRAPRGSGRDAGGGSYRDARRGPRARAGSDRAAPRRSACAPSRGRRPAGATRGRRASAVPGRP